MLTLVCGCLLSTLAVAQNSNMVFFSQEGEAFWVVLNGLKQNENPETNVKIAGLTPTSYKAKIIFKDNTLGEVTKNIYLDPGYEMTFNIRKKKESAVGNKFKSVGKTISKDLNMKEPENKKVELYVMRLQSKNPLAAPPPPVQQQTVVKYTPAPPPTTQTVVVQEQTTTTISGDPHHSENVSVGMNVGAPGLSVNVDIHDGHGHGHGHSHQEVTTSTTTVIHTEGTTTNAAYVMPGYNGPIGCPHPMSDGDFAGVRNSISSKDFEDSKKTMAKQVIASNCLLSSQVRDVMNLFDFEDTKLDIAKYAYGYTYDLGNYYKVNDAFDFEMSIDELNTYINSR